VHADDGPVGITNWNHTKMFALVVCVDEIKFAFSVFPHFENYQLTLLNRNIRRKRLSDCANNVDFVLSTFENLGLTD